MKAIKRVEAKIANKNLENEKSKNEEQKENILKTMQKNYTDDDIKKFKMIRHGRKERFRSNKNKADANERQEMLDDSNFLSLMENWLGEENIHHDLLHYKKGMYYILR
jgi:hypothetical protein